MFIRTGTRNPCEGGENRILTLPLYPIVLRFREVGSTQDVAIELVREGRKCFDAVRADLQTSGRGRRSTNWITAKGDLTVSYILWDCEIPEHPWILGLAAACSAAEAIRDLIRPTGLSPMVRWPNDVLVADRKIAGVLLEIVRDRRGTPVPVLGVGINLVMATFPAELEEVACSVRQLTNKTPSADEVECALWKAIMARYPWEEALILSEFRSMDSTPGHQVTAMDGRVGVALSVTDQGLLLVRWSDGAQAVVTTEHVRCGPEAPL